VLSNKSKFKKKTIRVPVYSAYTGSVPSTVMTVYEV